MSQLRSRHFVITLSGSAEALSASATDGGIRWISFQPGAANANPIFVGGAAVSTTVYGTRLPASSGGIPPAPFIIGEFEDGSLFLRDFYVIGTVDEKLHVHVLSYESPF